jgi:hypothetical protein
MITPVGPVAVVAWAGVRRRWASLLLLTVVLGLTGAVVLAGVAGSRRGRTTLDEFVEFHRLGGVEAFVDPSLPLARQEALLADIVEASGAPEAFVSLASVVVALPGPEGVTGPGTDLVVVDAYLSGEPLLHLERALVIDGDLPLAPGEAALNERLAERRGVTVGDTIDLALFAPEDLNRVGNGQAADSTTTVTRTVGAIVRTPLDLARSPQAQPGTIFDADGGRIVLEPSFWEEHGRTAAMYGMGSLADLPADELDEAVAAMQAAGGERALVNPSGSEVLSQIEPVGDAIDLESNAMLALALVVLVFGLAVIGTALARATGEDPDDRETLGTLGLTRRQLTASGLLRGGLVAVLATVIAVVAAVPASALFPIGLAADAEIHPGVQVDGLVLLAGGLGFTVLVAARIALGAWSDQRRAIATPAGTGASRLPVTMATLGARRVIDGLGRGGAAAGRLALVTAVIGVAAVSGAATFAASMAQLVDFPERQGWTWDVVVGNYSEQDAADLGEAALAANPDVIAFAPYQSTTFTVDGETVALAQLDPDGLVGVPTVLEGRAPIGNDEVALGRGTLALLGKEIGDTVVIGGSPVDVTATIVGEVVAPATISTAMDLDSGGVTTFELAAVAFGEVEQAVAPAGFLVDLDDAGDREAMLDRLEEDFPGTVLGPMKPLDVADLERVRGVPYLLAGLLGTLALVSVVVTLASAARRRRREVAVLRSLGLARDQLRRLVSGEASTFVLLATLGGVPSGVVAGRLLWTLAADGLGSEVGPAVPLAAITATVLLVLALVNLYAQGLAVVVARRRPGTDLRTE